MSRPASPQEVIETGMNGAATRDLDRLYLLYAEDAIVEHPFALPSPGRMQGRNALKAHFERFAEAPFTLTVHDMVVHQTSDPEVVVAEWRYEGAVVAT